MESEPRGGDEGVREPSLEAEVSRLVVRTLHEYSGRGPTKARTTIDRDLVVCVIGDTLTRAERTLAEAGHADQVLASRKLLQDVMRPELTSEMERLMERKVVAFISNNHIDPDLATETFILEAERRERTEAQA
jgi:uncharacterized protein YbcI